jgi:hypothetical protein
MLKNSKYFFCQKKIQNYKNNFYVKNYYNFSNTNTKIPHYEIIRKNDNKRALLFGSVHILPIHNINIDLRKKFMNCSDLVLEHFLDCDHFNYKKFISEYENGIIDKNKILLLFDNLSPEKFKFTQKKFYQPSAGIFLPKDFIDQLNNTHFFKKANINLNNLYIKNFTSFLLKILDYQGLDYMICYHFLLNNKKVYGLDNNDDKHKIELKKFWDDVERHFFRICIILRFFCGKKIFDKHLPNHFLLSLYDDTPLKESNYNSYMLHERNRIWIPKINDYIEKLDYPLFVVGHAHISELLDLLNDTNLYNIKKL